MAFTMPRRGSLAIVTQSSLPGPTAVIPLGTGDADGLTNYSSVQPGDIVHIESGTRGRLRLENFTGTAENPIIFMNDGGVVNIAGTYIANGGSGNYAGIEIRNCKHIRVTGSNITGVRVGAEYPENEQMAGIKITNIERGVSVKHLTRFADELPGGGTADLGIEIDHIDIGPIARIGIHVSDDNLDRGYTLLGLDCHHLYIHDNGPEGLGMPPNPSVTGEGFYVGSSDYIAGTFMLMGDVQITNCLLTRINRDAIQLGSCPVGTNIISYNVVDTTGLSVEESQSFGIIINRGTSADIIGNRIFNAGRDGIRDQGLHGPGLWAQQVIANNLIVDSGGTISDGSGIDVRQGNQAADNPDTPGFPHSVWVLNNTVAGTADDGIRCRVVEGGDNQIRNNIIYGIASGVPVEYGSGASGTSSNNLTSNPLFVDASGRNYQLQETSPAIDGGFPLTDIVTDDIVGTSRPQHSGWDIGAYEYDGPV